jgi:hypothetical protein
VNPSPEKQRLKAERLIALDCFLGRAVCSRLLREMEKDRWRLSQTVKLSLQGTTKEVVTGARNSSTIVSGGWTPVAHSIVRQIEASLERKLGIRSHRLEEWQITRYLKGEFYDFHLDCGCWGKDPAGERKRTIMIYLESPKEGGDTYFRALNLWVTPVRGRLVIWNNLLQNGNCNHAMIHAGLPVLRGRKTILVTWERERRYIRMKSWA